MAELWDQSTAFEVRDGLVAAHRRAWDRLGRPGTWLDGESRIAVAAEARHGPGCDLCRRRKAALSPNLVDGIHDSLGDLPANRVEMIHRIVSDPGRLTQGWYEAMLESGIADTTYVEIVSVVAHLTAIDTFARGLGVPPPALPEPVAGAPTRYRPAAARQHAAWAPNIADDEHGPDEADLFPTRPTANIRRALTLVPDEARGFFDVVTHQYMSGPEMRDFSREFRAISHSQIELLAARVSAINQCTY